MEKDSSKLMPSFDDKLAGGVGAHFRKLGGSALDTAAPYNGEAVIGYGLQTACSKSEIYKVIISCVISNIAVSNQTSNMFWNPLHIWFALI